MTRIFDNLFPGQAALHVNGDNFNAVPEKVVWRREGPPIHNAWFTDSSLYLARDAHEVTTTIAWLLEPYDLHPTPYDVTEQMEFDFVLTHSREHVERLGWIPYCFGGTRIHANDRKVWNKLWNTSIIASAKDGMEGHKLRHALIDHFLNSDRLDVYGIRGIGATKLHSLNHHRFHVAIENCRRDWWFTEAIIDPMLCGTVPIFWGCPSIADFFDPAGIIQCADLDELEYAVRHVTESMYESMLPAVHRNFERAKQFVCTEDWLYRQYPRLFDE